MRKLIKRALSLIILILWVVISGMLIYTDNPFLQTIGIVSGMAPVFLFGTIVGLELEKDHHKNDTPEGRSEECERRARESMERFNDSIIDLVRHSLAKDERFRSQVVDLHRGRTIEIVEEANDPLLWHPVTGFQPEWVICLCTCANGHLATLSTMYHKVAEDGTVTPSYVCPYKDCGFHVFVRLMDWNI